MDSDPWLALDKLEHFIFCASIVWAVYECITRCLRVEKAFSLAFAITLSIIAASFKEVGDYLKVRMLSPTFVGASYKACKLCAIEPEDQGGPKELQGQLED